MGPGIYTVAVESEGGCVVNEFEITEPPLLELNLAEYQTSPALMEMTATLIWIRKEELPVYTFF